MWKKNTPINTFSDNLKGFYSKVSCRSPNVSFQNWKPSVEFETERSELFATAASIGSCNLEFFVTVVSLVSLLGNQIRFNTVPLIRVQLSVLVYGTNTLWIFKQCYRTVISEHKDLQRAMTAVIWTTEWLCVCCIVINSKDESFRVLSTFSHLKHHNTAYRGLIPSL